MTDRPTDPAVLDTVRTLVGELTELLADAMEWATWLRRHSAAT